LQVRFKIFLSITIFRSLGIEKKYIISKIENIKLNVSILYTEKDPELYKYNKSNTAAEIRNIFNVPI